MQNTQMFKIGTSLEPRGTSESSQDKDEDQKQNQDGVYESKQNDEEIINMC